MNLDEELQKKVESGKPDLTPEEEADGVAYRSVFTALEKEPSYRLPSNFASSVVAAIQAEVARREARKDKWWLALGLMGMVGALAYALISIDFAVGAGAFSFISGYKGVIVFTGVVILCLQIIDKYVFPRISKKI